MGDSVEIRRADVSIIPTNITRTPLVGDDDEYIRLLRKSICSMQYEQYRRQPKGEVLEEVFHRNFRAGKIEIHAAYQDYIKSSAIVLTANEQMPSLLKDLVTAIAT